mgnify:CR=1 FL=1
MKLWIVAADMGYGHLRAAYSFEKNANLKILNIGNDEFTSEKVKSKWKIYQGMYEVVSRNKNKHIIGKFLFGLMNDLLWIPNLYTKRDLSQPTYQVKMLYKQIQKGLYDDFIKIVSDNHLPIFSTFYAPSIAADFNGRDNNYCFITDSDLNRVWVAENPQQSKIKYFVASDRAYYRLLKYGVKNENIFKTGYPFNDEILTEEAVKNSLVRRLKIFDPEGKSELKKIITEKIGFDYTDVIRKEPLTITFAVGGAGAQRELARKILKGFKNELYENKIKFYLVAGSRNDVREYFDNLVEKENYVNVEIIYEKNKMDYFKKFDNVMLQTDILWTKPSELSFYTAIGLPIIIAPTIGAQEEANKKWLRDEMGIGIIQNKPSYAKEWVEHHLKSKRFVDAAILGFLKQNIDGKQKILNIIKDNL